MCYQNCSPKIISVHVYLRLVSYNLLSEIEKILDLAVIFSHGFKRMKNNALQRIF